MSQAMANSHADNGEIYVVIGGSKPGVCEACPFVQSGKHAPSWPVVFKLYSAEAAQILAPAHDIIEQGNVFEMSPLESALWIMSNKAIKRISMRNEVKGPYYPLISGNGSSIVYPSREELMGKVQGGLFTSWRRLENFQEALACMVLRGNKTKAIAWTDNPDAPTSTRSQHSNPSSTQAASPGRYHTSPQTSPRRSPLRNTTPGAFPSAIPTPTIRRIWTHSRTMAGIVNTHYTQPVVDNTQELPPSFNTTADWYFAAHGYTSSTLWALFNMWQSNKNDEDSFVEALWNAGMPHTEAEWVATLLFGID